MAPCEGFQGDARGCQGDVEGSGEGINRAEEERGMDGGRGEHLINASAHLIPSTSPHRRIVSKAVLIILDSKYPRKYNNIRVFAKIRLLG